METPSLRTAPNPREDPRREPGFGASAARGGLSRTLALACAYCLTGAVGLSLALPPGYATVVWPPSGIALAGLLLWGPRVWPGIWLGSFVVNVWVSLAPADGRISLTPFVVAASIAVGSTLQALLGAALLRRFLGVDRIFESGETVLAFGFMATMCCLLAPTWGVTTLSLAGLVDYSSYFYSWRTWWLGDVTGVLVVAPALLKWRKLVRDQLRPWQRVEAVSLLALLGVTTAFVFLTPSSRLGGALAPSFLPLPCLVWVAFRFRPRGVAVATLLLSAVAVCGTYAGTGPFARGAANDSLLLLQTFTALTTMMALTLSAAVTGHRESEASLRRLGDELQQLALTDELTGLRNRRGFLLVADQGLKVARRSRARCLLVFVDLDGLKQVNDTQGHRAGDALIVDAARVLTSVFRESDVIARVGGDEFAVFALVDKSDTSVAIGGRLQEKLAEFNRQSGRSVPLAMSIGMEELSGDAEVSLVSLLSKADHAMYEQKREETQRRRTGETRRPA